MISRKPPLVSSRVKSLLTQLETTARLLVTSFYPVVWLQVYFGGTLKCLNWIDYRFRTRRTQPHYYTPLGPYSLHNSCMDWATHSHLADSHPVRLVESSQ